MIKITAWVDDMAIASELILPFYQRDPYPGGHKYVLTFSFEDDRALRKFTRDIDPGKLENVDWSIFFLRLSACWREYEENLRARYLINNVENIVIDDCTLTLNGICAPVLPQVVS